MQHVFKVLRKFDFIDSLGEDGVIFNKHEVFSLKKLESENRNTLFKNTLLEFIKNVHLLFSVFLQMKFLYKLNMLNTNVVVFCAIITLNYKQRVSSIY